MEFVPKEEGIIEPRSPKLEDEAVEGIDRMDAVDGVLEPEAEVREARAERDRVWTTGARAEVIDF